MSFTDRILVVVDSASAGAVKEMDRLQRSARDADAGVSALGKTMKGALVAGAAAFAGAGLVSFLNDSVTAYAEAAKKAGELAEATGGSVENVSRMTAALADNGVTAEQTAALLSKFAATVGKNDGLLGKYGVTLKKNADGSADYADAMVQVVDNIGRIGDASKRQAALTEVFGKKQAAVFQELAASGVSLSDAMKAVSQYRVFGADDVARAVAYDDAMDKLGGSVQGLQFALGEALVPALSATADILAEVVEFMSGIPVEVYAAVGGFVALKGAMGFFGPALSKTVSDVALGMTGLGAAAENAGGKAELVKKGLGGAVSAIGPWNLALAGLAATFTAVSMGADNAQARLEQFASGMDGSLQSLQSSAAGMLESSSPWERFWVSLTNSTQSLNPGTWTRILNEALVALFDDSMADVEVYENALRKVREEMGSTAAAAADLAVQQKDLNDLITAFLQNDPSVTWADITAAAQEAAEAQGLVSEATRIAAEQLAIATGDVGFFLDALQRLENVGGSSVEALKADLQGISFAQVADKWGDEAVIGAERAYDTIVSGLKAALEQNPQLDLTAWLEQFRGLSPELDGIITQILADVGTDKKLQAALGITADPSVGEAQAALDALGNPVEGSFDLSTGEGVAAAKASKDDLAKPVDTTITFATMFDPGGYEAVKARKDYLVQDRTGSVGINVNFSPDGYNALKSRVDYLSQNRTATITQVVNQVTGTRAGGGEGGGDTGRSANTLFSPINMVRVSLDGRELRSVIDDEIRALTPTTQEVA